MGLISNVVMNWTHSLSLFPSFPYAHIRIMYNFPKYKISYMVSKNTCKIQGVWKILQGEEKVLALQMINIFTFMNDLVVDVMEKM